MTSSHRRRMAQLEKHVLDLHARVRFLSGSVEPVDVMDRHYYLDLICKHLSEMVALRRAACDAEAPVHLVLPSR